MPDSRIDEVTHDARWWGEVILTKEVVNTDGCILIGDDYLIRMGK